MNCKHCFHTVRLEPRNCNHVRACCHCGEQFTEVRTVEHHLKRAPLVRHGIFIWNTDYRYHEAKP